MRLVLPAWGSTAAATAGGIETRQYSAPHKEEPSTHPCSDHSGDTVVKDVEPVMGKTVAVGVMVISMVTCTTRGEG